MHNIAEQLTLDSQFSRSISLERDLDDASALSGYMVTPAVLSALTQIGTAVKTGRRQRAWKIIGPYGSGKSSLALLLARLLSGPRQSRSAFSTVHEVAPDVDAMFRPGKNLLPLAVTGSRTSFGRCLANNVHAVLTSWGDKESAKIAKAVDLENGTYRGQRFNAAVASLLKDFAAHARKQGYGGVLLLVDELGKFVEHAALSPAEGDLMALQQVAELACGNDEASLFVIAMLHQHLNDYASGVGRASTDEWHKVSGRFDEVAFDEPVQRYAHFAAHALASSEALRSNNGVRRSARAAYRNAIADGVLNSAGDADRVLFANAERLYPLHPTALSAMAYIAKRMGQSERSFHAFLRGYEPAGLRDYAQRHAPTPQNWYACENLFDFLSQGARLRFRDLATERRWAFASAVIEDCAEKGLENVRVLKAMAVLELVRFASRQPVTPSAVAFSLADALGEDDVRTVLEGFRARGILVRNGASEAYSFAVNESLNVDALYDAAGRGSADLHAAGLQKLLGENRVVASGHYHRTGTLRTVSFAVGGPAADFGTGAKDVDGRINVILIDDTRPEQRRAAEELVRSTADRPCLWTSIDLDHAALLALEELSRWTFVQEEIRNGSLDPWTMRYVDGALTDARQRVERNVLSRLSVQAEVNPLEYRFNGEIVPVEHSASPSQAVSWMFDRIFTECPVIVNELINKDRPSPAIVLARQRLFERLMNTSAPGGELFKETEFPPERLIYATLLRNTGTHVNGALIATPGEGRLAGVWTRIEAILASQELISFREILEELSRPPFGIRQGASSIWLVAYLLVHRNACAVFERQTLVLEFTSDHLSRLFKNPDVFRLRRFDGEGENGRLFQRYYAALAQAGQILNGVPTFLELSRTLMRWYARLPQYGVETMKISAEAKLLRSTLKRATDPIQLLVHDIPMIYGCAATSELLTQRLAATLTEVGAVFRKLQDDVASTLGAAFGIAGSLPVVRAKLQSECSSVAADLADVELKSFMLRCVDVAPVDDRWLDSVATLIVKRPMESWADDSLAVFRDAIAELSGRYKRWLRLAVQHGRHREAAQRYLSVTLTAFGGDERALVLTTSDQAQALAEGLLGDLRMRTGNNRELLQAALLQALNSTFDVPEHERGAAN
ncbi:hypothetical protein A9R05_15600 [Burkholderia sp. KK1]|nr:hypothetical protein A9R05_15600 [Burkholderia sp. KK1]